VQQVKIKVEYMCNISERLLEERKRLGLNQDKMAEIGGVAKRTYCNYESGEREPMGSFFTAIATAGADVQYILTGIRATPQAQPTLSPREAALLDNYQHTDDYGKGIIEATAFAAAESKQVKKKA
jgi:transcriptional regulator with XRE-family HTH domain